MSSTYYLDFEGGNDANDGTSFANRRKTLASAAGLLSPGDNLRVMAALAPVAMSVNAAWVNLDPTLTLSGAVNADIEACGAAWSNVGVNVTCITSTTRKEGLVSSEIQVGAAFTTGLAAYRTISSTDYSAYQQITFWIRQSNGTLAVAADISIKLCSDTLGVTPVDTFDLPALVASNTWVPIVINKGSGMGAAIQSVALYVNVDRGAQTFQIDNISAVKASGNQDELHLQMLIGKASSIGAGGADTQTWYSIRSIRGAVITLDTSLSGQPTTDATFCVNSTSTETAYHWTPIYLPTTITSTDLAITHYATAVLRTTISGGWDRTAMTAKTGYTMCRSPKETTINGTWIGNFLDISDIAFVQMTSWTLGPLNFSTLTRVQFLGMNNTVSLLGANLVADSSTVTTFVNMSLSGANATYAGLLESHTSQVLVTNGAAATFWLGSFLYQLQAPAGYGSAIYQSITYGGIGAVGLTSADVTAAVWPAPANGITDAAFAVPAQSAGRPTTILGMLRRLWEWSCNKRSRDRSSGAVTLRNSSDTSDLETQTQSTTESVDSQTQGA